MAGRRISVELTLDAQGYVDSAVKSAAATKAVDEALSRLRDQMSDTEREAAKLAITNAVASKEIGELGEKSNKATRDLSQLDRQIEATRHRVERLGIEFAATGDKVAGKRFGDQQSLLGKLESLRTSLRGMDDDGQIGRAHV